MRDRIASIFRRINFSGYTTASQVVRLRGVPFEDWPELALYAWLWTGTTARERIDGERYNRVRAEIRVNGHNISPARVLYQFFTGIEPPAGSKFHHKCTNASWRGVTQDDVNPAHYVIATGGPYVAKKYNAPRGPQPDKGLLWLMFEKNFVPTSVEELVARFPDAASIDRAILEATIDAIE